MGGLSFEGASLGDRDEWCCEGVLQMEGRGGSGSLFVWRYFFIWRGLTVPAQPQSLSQDIEVSSLDSELEDFGSIDL